MDELKRQAALLAAAQRLADGAALEGDPSVPGLAQLQQLAVIARAFEARRTTGADQSPPLFVWKHLQVREAIGKGGFGEVFRAFDPDLAREVALKLRRETAEGEVALPDRIFIEEARRLARVRHPNVLAVHGADRDRGRAGLWCDLVPGSSLQRLIDDDRRPPASRILEIAAALASALAAIHRAGLVHGDVKAANVMLQPDGTPVLMDFGAAIERGQGPQITAAGSPLVMAPELLAGATPSPASDQYALGVLVYQLLTGRYPVEASSLDRLLDSHQRGPAVDWLAVPRPFRPILRRLLASDPPERPTAATTGILLDEIRTRPLRRRRRIAVSAIIGSLVLGLFAAGYGLLEARRSERAALAAGAEAEDVTRFMAGLLQAPTGYTRGAQSTVGELLNDAVLELELSPPENPLRAARFRLAMGRAYSAMGEHEKAQALLEQALNGLESVEDRPRVEVATLIALGLNGKRQGRLQASRDALTMAKQMAMERLGAGDTLTLEARLRHAETLMALGELAAAQAELEQTHELAERLPPHEDLPSLVLDAMAAALRHTGQLEQAEAHSRRSLDRQLSLHNPAHVNVLAARDALATILIERGALADAESLLRTNLDILEERIPEGSPRTRATLVNLSSALSRMGRSHEAMALNRRALEMLERQLGAEHPDTLIAVSNHANRLGELGMLPEAESAYREAIERATRVFSDSHPLALINRGNLAELLLNMGRLEEAEALARSTLAVDIKTLGETHMFSLFAMDILGAALTRLGRNREGQEVLERVYALKHRELGPDNSYTVDSAVYLAEALLDAGEIERARGMLEDAVARRRVAEVSEPAKLAHARELLAQAREGQR